jgi:class 3 adenylate cyclase
MGLLDIAALPGDDPELALKKRLQLAMAASSVPAVFSNGALLFAFGRLDAALPCWLYCVATVALFGVLAATKRFELFRGPHTCLVLIAPISLHFYLGGFAGSGAMMLWALIAPVAAMMISSRTRRFAIVVVIAAAATSLVYEWRFGPSARALSSSQASVFFAFNTIGLAGFVYFSTRFFVRRLEAERARSERLLLNVLPKEIAERLKRDPNVIADRFESVTVMFADLVGFTTLSQRLSAKDVVELLNDIFTRFDQLADEHHLEKIKTIGDAYMVVGGLPTPDADHAKSVAKMALAMKSAIDEIARARNIDVNMRIGIHSGDVVAGVIGRRKFSYDLWGDTVNTASRMESHGAPGRIQISAATEALLRGEFTLEKRGTIDVKGKGPMETYWLERSHGGVGQAPALRGE